MQLPTSEFDICQKFSPRMKIALQNVYLSATMNTLLWIFQSLLCLVFLYSGIMKSTKTNRQLVQMGQTGVEGLPNGFIHFIGVMEIIGAIGIILPWLLHVHPILTPIAAICFSIIMVCAGIIHIRRKEYKTALGNFAIFSLAIFVAIERLQ